jgi:hypothetical protein
MELMSYNCEVYLLSRQTYAIITLIGNLFLEPKSSTVAIMDFALNLHAIIGFALHYY